MSEVIVKNFKYTSKEHYEKIKILREFDLIPRELGGLCVKYIGCCELVAQSITEFNIERNLLPVLRNLLPVFTAIQITHTPLQFKNVHMISSNYKWESVFQSHDHTFYIDVESNQVPLNRLKHLERFIRQKHQELSFSIKPVQKTLHNTKMKLMSLVCRNKSILTFCPVKTKPYYEITFDCSRQDCKQNCPNLNDPLLSRDYEDVEMGQLSLQEREPEKYNKYKADSLDSIKCDIVISLSFSKTTGFSRSYWDTVRHTYGIISLINYKT